MMVNSTRLHHVAKVPGLRVGDAFVAPAPGPGRVLPPAPSCGAAHGGVVGRALASWGCDVEAFVVAAGLAGSG